MSVDACSSNIDFQSIDVFGPHTWQKCPNNFKTLAMKIVILMWRTWVTFPRLECLPAIIWPYPFLAGHSRAADWLERSGHHRHLAGERGLYKESAGAQTGLLTKTTKNTVQEFHTGPKQPRTDQDRPSRGPRGGQVIARDGAEPLGLP